MKITLIPMADMHTCGTTALFPLLKKVNGQYVSIDDLGGWQYKDNPHYYPNSKQRKIWYHLEKTLDYAAEKRQGTKLLLLNMGDSIDGDHHNNTQNTTRNPIEQIDTHVELMQYIKTRLDWQAGDTLAYVRGTKSHVETFEEKIAEELGAYQYNSGEYTSDFLELHLNGVKTWAYHHGLSAGDYPNKGNALHNQLKRIYYKCQAERITPPGLVLSAHTHDPWKDVFSSDWFDMTGIILPSWQDKTRYANDKMPLAINKIGMQLITIDDNGNINAPFPLLLTSPLGDMIKI